MTTQPIDPVRLEVIKNGFDTIADEMALILMRAAYSPIVRDAMDFSTAICDGAGRPLAQGLTTPLHLGSFHDAMRFLLQRFEGRLYDGDILIANDPYIAAGQHLPDIYIVRPIFLAGACAGFATTVAHHVDVGGIIPGSNALGAHEMSCDHSKILGLTGLVLPGYSHRPATRLHRPPLVPASRGCQRITSC
jgi:N-methylhydantoinase B